MAESRTCSIEEAAAELGIGRGLAYELARQGAFPVKLLRIGRLYRVVRADLDRALSEGLVGDEPDRATIEAQARAS